MRLVLWSLLAVMAATSAAARIGEKVEAAKDRYSKISAYKVHVQGLNGVSVLERFSKKNNEDFVEAEIQAILNANSGGLTWEAGVKEDGFKKGAKMWRRADGVELIREYRSVTISISDEALAKIRAEEKAKKEKTTKVPSGL